MCIYIYIYIYITIRTNYQMVKRIHVITGKGGGNHSVCGRPKNSGDSVAAYGRPTLPHPPPRVRPVSIISIFEFSI